MKLQQNSTIPSHNTDRSYIFLHVVALIYLPIGTIFTSLVDGVASVKIMHFEEYPSSAI